MKPPRSNRLGMYSDIRAVLDEALTSGGGTLECATHGAAVHWRQRAYRFRKLFAETIAAESPYDTLVLPRCDTNVVRIELRRSAGQFIPAHAPTPPPEDDIFDFAAALAKRIDEGEE